MSAAAADSAPAPTSASVMHLVNKLSDADPDFRFMALNDLIVIFSKAKPDFLHHDYNIAARTVDSIIKTLDDQNGEVQNLAIKCLGPLVTKVPATIIAPLLEKLASIQLRNAVDTAIPSMALRTAIAALPRPTQGAHPNRSVQEAYSAVSRVLIPRLVGPGDHPRPSTSLRPGLPQVPQGLLQNEKDLNSEAVDVLTEVVKAFGPMLSAIEVEAMLDAVLDILALDHGTPVVKKRAVLAGSVLAVHLSDDLLAQMAQRIASVLSKPSVSPITRRIHIALMGSVARSIPHRFSPHLPTMVPFLLQALGEEDLIRHAEEMSDGGELNPEYSDSCEAALVALEAFLASCPAGMEPFTDDALNACLRFLKFDPNLATDDEAEDDEMDMDEEDNPFADDDEFDVDGDFDDDDDASWKVRRCAAKALYTFISIRANDNARDSEVLYGKAGPAIIKRMGEREENVRLEVIACLALLVRKTGDDLALGSSGWGDVDDPEDGVPYKLPVSRKRRRQSSVAEAGGLSPTLERAPATGPRAELVRLTPSIVKASNKHLKGKAISTRQSIVNLFNDIVKVQRGGLAEFLQEIMGPVIDSISSSGVGSTVSNHVSTAGNASATQGTLRIAALQLMSSIAKTHSSHVLQPYIARIVAGVLTAVGDRYYKVSCEAIRTVEDIVKNITPPRSKLGPQKFKAELQSLFDVLMDHVSKSQAETEVRQRAIQALGVLLARTLQVDGGEAIAPEKRKAAMAALLERLRMETTRLSAVRAVDTVAMFTTKPGELSKDWIQPVAMELSTQLRKINRGLRTSSIQALKHLITSPTVKGQLDPPTIEGLVSALDSVVNSFDAYLLAPALLILAQLVEEDASIVITTGMTQTVCNLLKSSSASVALDQLLVLVTKVGESGAGQPLMQGLLQIVSIEGNPAIVGKVIGALLVSSGNSAGVTIDSFVSELEASAEDEARVSLALAVLGEAGLRLGTNSPLQPDLFLKQFRGEPDKVSMSAAAALGRAGSGNIPVYVPIIVKKMDLGGNTQYLLVQSIKEILLQAAAQSSSTSNVSKYSEGIWKKLLEASTDPENAVVCAECIGRLVIIDPKKFMPALQSLLEHENSRIRGMAVQAVRYTLPENDDVLDAAFKEALLGMLLTMLKDDKMDNRRLAMSTLNSAAHNKPDLILPHLGRLMPFVLAESKVKPELIREVQMGPFKIMVDDGLDVRKSAYEMLYALMETAYLRMNKADLYDRILAGLRDDNDIRSLCNLMVSKLVAIDADEIARRLDEIAEAYRTVLSTKLKETAVKQDVEKHDEANRSALRVTLLLAEKVAGGAGGGAAARSNLHAAGSNQTWEGYWEWVCKDFQPVLKTLREEKDLQKQKHA